MELSNRDFSIRTKTLCASHNHPLLLVTCRCIFGIRLQQPVTGTSAASATSWCSASTRKPPTQARYRYAVRFSLRRPIGYEPLTHCDFLSLVLPAPEGCGNQMLGSRCRVRPALRLPGGPVWAKGRWRTLRLRLLSYYGECRWFVQLLRGLPLGPLREHDGRWLIKKRRYGGNGDNEIDTFLISIDYNCETRSWHTKWGKHLGNLQEVWVKGREEWICLSHFPLREKSVERRAIINMRGQY